MELETVDNWPGQLGNKPDSYRFDPGFISNWRANARSDEVKLLARMLEVPETPELAVEGVWRPRDIGPELGIHPKRLDAILSKWSGRDWYDYGTCLDSGWIQFGKRPILAQLAERLE